MAAVDHSGGLDAIAAQLPAGLDWFDPFAGIPLAVIIGWFIVMITQAITAQGPVQRAQRLYSWRPFNFPGRLLVRAFRHYRQGAVPGNFGNAGFA